MREQLKFLEGIDRVHTKRKQEQEREKLLKAAKVNINYWCTLIVGVWLFLVYAYCLCMLNVGVYLILMYAYFQCMFNVGVCLCSLISEQVKIR